jgi:hypothetical protein
MLASMLPSGPTNRPPVMIIFTVMPAASVRSINKVSCREDELTGTIDQTVEIVTAAAAAIDD